LFPLWQDKDGRIINIASMTRKRPLPMRTSCCAAKMGLIGFTRSLASELGRYNLNVNAICPGAVGGQGSRESSVMKFLASEDSRNMTGQDMNVTAGVVMY